MGTTAQKLAAVASSKASIAAALTARGITPPTPFKDYGDAVRMLSRIWDAEVEYVESTGTQYVDTGVMTGPNTRSETDIDVTWGSIYNLALSGSGGSRHVFGRGWTSSPRNADLYIGLGENNYDTGVLLSNLTGRHTYWVDATLGKGGYDDTGFSVSATVTENAFTSILLAQRKSATGIRGYMNAKLYGCRYYQSGVLVRDFIPVRVGSGSSAVGYLFDRVSGELFGNAGTGAFVIGPDKNGG